MALDIKRIEEEYAAGKLNAEEKAAWEGMRDNVPMNMPEKADPDTFYSVLENKVHKGQATPRELFTVKHAALNGEYIPKVVTFKGDDGRTSVPGYARSDSDSFLGDLAYQGEGFLAGAGKALKNTGEEVQKIAGIGNKDQINAEQNARSRSDTALAEGRTASSTVGGITGDIAATAPIGLGAGAGLRALGVGGKLAATAEGVGTGAIQGALMPTNEGQSRAGNALLGAGVGGAVGIGLPMLAEVTRKGINAGKAAFGVKTEVNPLAQEAIDSSNAAGELGITTNPAHYLQSGGTAKGVALSASDAPLIGARSIFQDEQQGVLRTAGQIRDKLKAANAKASFDNVDELGDLSLSSNPHASEAEAAIRAIDVARQTGNWRDVVQANLGGNLIARKAKYADEAGQIRDAAYGIQQTPTELVDTVQKVADDLSKIKTLPPAVRGEVEALQKRVGKAVTDPDTGITEYPVKSVGDMMDSLQVFKERVRQLANDGVIGKSELASLRPIENSWNNEIKNGLAKYDPDLADRYVQNKNFYKTEIAPFHDQTLSDAIRSFGTGRSKNALGKSVEDMDRFAELAPLLGEKGKAALAEGIYTDALDQVLLKAGTSDQFSVKAFRSMLQDKADILDKVVKSPEQRDLIKGVMQVVNRIAPGNRVAEGAGNRLGALSTPTAITGATATSLGLGGKASTVGFALIGGVKAIKMLSNSPVWREKLIRIGNLPPSSPLAVIYRTQVSNAVSAIVNAQRATRSEDTTQ